eukprot:727176-Alexandrium_andersonii.AAC.1
MSWSRLWVMCSVPGMAMHLGNKKPVSGASSWSEQSEADSPNDWKRDGARHQDGTNSEYEPWKSAAPISVPMSVVNDR